MPTAHKAFTAITISALVSFVNADVVNINGYDFELDQFDGAWVNYKSDGSVDFDGKEWDNIAGVDGLTLGELAAGQYGADPGDQVSLQGETGNEDWLQLNYGTPFQLVSSQNQLVIHEISSVNFVDPEGMNFRISVNGGALVDASSAISAVNYDAGGDAEDVNQLVFDLFAMGFEIGDSISSVYIENIWDTSNPGASDPDFIFAGITTPTPGTAMLLGLGGLAAARRRR